MNFGDMQKAFQKFGADAKQVGRVLQGKPLPPEPPKMPDVILTPGKIEIKPKE